MKALVIASTAILAACGARGDYERAQSAGHVPCAIGTIKVLKFYETDPSGTAALWTVSCNGQQYQCAQQLQDVSMYMAGISTVSAPSCQPIQAEAPAKK